MSSLKESNVADLISSIDNLPTPPVVFSRINESISNPNSSAYQIASIISEDPAMSAKILRLSNSAFYGIRNEITSVKQAIITIGLEAIRSLVLSTSVFDAFKTNPEFAQQQDQFWRHSLAVASACRVIARRVSADWIQDTDKVFSAGMLHDIGKLVLLAYFPYEWEKIKKQMKDSQAKPTEVEKQILGYTHTDLGAALADRWNLPEVLHDAIAFHHKPLESPLKDSLAPLVFCGNFLSDMLLEQELDPEEIELDEETTEVFAYLKLGPDSIKALRTGLIEEYAKSQVFLEIARGL
ncbi:MAG: HDOD domain-containing protein [candidate division Zixibacteria bacterium]|nr:HDOD domain-containing protein [candidate division Zixibacteria bacterium]